MLTASLLCGELSSRAFSTMGFLKGNRLFNWSDQIVLRYTACSNLG